MSYPQQSTKALSKPSLTFYTNMPTPYNLDFFKRLASHFNLRVVYFCERELDRSWQLKALDSEYSQVFLKSGKLMLAFQKKVPSLHFSSAILGIAVKDKSTNIIVNGTYWSPNVIIVMMISYLKGKRIAFFGEPIFPTANKLVRQIKHLSFLPVRLFSSFILAIGARAVLSYRSYGYPKPLYKVPYNIEMDHFRSAAVGRQDGDRYSILVRGSSETVFLTSGALIHRKGIDIVIRAFNLLPSHLNCRLVILGDGPERASLEKLAEDNKNINFAGFVEKEEMPYYFTRADIFVFASRYDGWALVINEAVAAGLAIISSDKVGASSDLLTNEVSALICPSEKVECFRDAMQRLACDKHMRGQLVLNMKNVEEEFSSAFNAKKVYDIFGYTEQ